MGNQRQTTAPFALVGTLALLVTCLAGETVAIREESVVKRDVGTTETFDQQLEDIRRLVGAINSSCEDKLAVSSKLQFQKDMEMVQLKNELHEVKQKLSMLSMVEVNTTEQSTTTQTIGINHAPPMKTVRKEPDMDREMLRRNQELLEEVLRAFNETKQKLEDHENLLVQLEVDLQTEKVNMVRRRLEAISMSHQFASFQASVDDLKQAHPQVVEAVNETRTSLNHMEDDIEILKRKQNRLQQDLADLKSAPKNDKASTSSHLLQNRKLQDLVDRVDIIAYKTSSLDNKVSNLSELCNLDAAITNSVSSQDRKNIVPSLVRTRNSTKQTSNTCGCAKEIDNLQNQLNSTSTLVAFHGAVLALIQPKVNEASSERDQLNSTIRNLTTDLTASRQAAARGLIAVSTELKRVERELNTTSVKDGLKKVQQQITGMNATLMALKIRVDSVESQVIQQKGAVASAAQNASVALFESKTIGTALEKLRKAVAAYHANKQVQCVADKCAGGYSFNPHSKTCYKQFNVFKNWQDAQNYCKGQGGNLATFPTLQSAQWVFAQRRAKNAGFNDGESSWIGGKRNRRGADFQWVGLTQGSINYRAWAPGMPDRDYELCLEILDKEGFNDGECDWTHRDLICERRATC